MLSPKTSIKSAGDQKKRKVAISANQIVEFEGTSVGFHPYRTKSEQVFEVVNYLQAINKDKVIDFFSSIVPTPILQLYQALSQRMLVPLDRRLKGVYSFITREMLKGDRSRKKDEIPFFSFGDKDQIKALLEEMRGWQNDGMHSGHITSCSNFKDDPCEYGATFHKSNLEAMYPKYNMNPNFCKEFVVKEIAKKFVICWHFMIPYYGVRLDGSAPIGNGQIADGFVTILLAKDKDGKYYSFVLAIDHDKHPTDSQVLEMLKDVSILKRLNIPYPFAGVKYTEVTMQNENLLLPSLKLKERLESFNRSSFVAFGNKAIIPIGVCCIASDQVDCTKIHQAGDHFYVLKDEGGGYHCKTCASSFRNPRVNFETRKKNVNIPIGVRCMGSDQVDCTKIHQAGDGFVRVADRGGGYFCKTCASSFRKPGGNFEKRKKRVKIPIGVRCLGSDSANCDEIHQKGDGFVRAKDGGGGYFCSTCDASFRNPRTNFEIRKKRQTKPKPKSEPKLGLRRSARLNQKEEPVPNKKRKLG